jgi:hypothetical protein
MDDWRDRLAEQMVGKSLRPGFTPDAAAQMEIVLGRARSEITYFLELGRAHRLPVGGSVNGDDVYLRLGQATLRFTYRRKDAAIDVTIPGRDMMTLKHEAGRLVDAAGSEVNAVELVRGALDATVAAWKKEEG